MRINLISRHNIDGIQHRIAAAEMKQRRRGGERERVLEIVRVLEGAEHLCMSINHKIGSHYETDKVTGEYK